MKKLERAGVIRPPSKSLAKRPTQTRFPFLATIKTDRGTHEIFVHKIPAKEHKLMNSEVDPRFDEAEAELERGNPWMFREPDAPNPLTIKATGWSTGHTKLGEAEFLNGVDRNGNAWSVLVGSTVLRRRLIDGEVSEWDDSRGSYVVTCTEGRVAVGEVVAIRFLGEKEGSSGNPYSDFAVSRKPLTPAATSSPAATPPDEDIPF